MAGNMLSKGFEKVPTGVIQFLAAMGASGLLAWASWEAKATVDNSKEIAIVHVQSVNTAEDIVEIKGSVRRIEDILVSGRAPRRK